MPVKPNRAGPEVPPVRPVYNEWTWQEQGNCVGMDVEIFFLPHNVRDSTKRALEDKAKAICVGCPVINECLDHALAVPENYGVFGGTTPEERLRMTEQEREEIQTISLRITTNKKEGK